MYQLEGGPFDGERVDVVDGIRVIRLPLRRSANVLTMSRGPQLQMDVAEYERAGAVYRHSGMIPDAQASMSIAAEAFREPEVRRMARRELRRELERLGKGRELGQVVWVLVRDRHRATYALTAVVGGRRSAIAAELRERGR